MTQQPAQARATTGRPSASGEPFGRPLEAAVLVEQARVDVQDQVADDVEAEVAGLDHAGVDRPDRDLVRIGPAHGRRESAEGHVVVDERPERLVAVEADAVEVVCLALVPAGGRSEVDDRRHRHRRAASTLSSRSSPAGEASSVRTAGRPPSRRGVQAREAPAVGERSRDRLAVLGSALRARLLIRAPARGRRRSPSRAARARRR